MHPILFNIGRLEIHSYGLMLALSFLIGIYWASKRAEDRSLNSNQVVDLSLFVLFGAVFGARVMYVLTHLEEFKGHWTDTFNPFQSSGQIGIAGLTMLGGVLVSLLIIIFYCNLKKISFLKLFDVMAPVFGFGIFLTRIGCFFNGCCYGQPCDLPWGVKFPIDSAAGFMNQGIALHPTQLYSSIYGFIMMVVLLLIDKKKRFDGLLAGVVFMMYGMFRFLVDFVRYYEKVDMVPGFQITINQLISLIMFLFGLGLLIVLKRKNSKP